MDSFNLNIILVNGNNLVIKCTSITKAEDLCTTLCRQLKIAPLTRTLFSLRLKDANLYLADNSHVDKNATYELRIRYKVPHLLYLKNVDINTYNYYFHQVRSDVLESAVPEIVYSKHKKEVLGLGTTDMYRIMQEERKSIEEVVRDYKKYIPKEIIKKHSIFIKKPINNTLARLQKTNHDVEFVKGQYFQKFESMAPNYLAEQYNALYEEAGSIYEVDVYVMPFDSQEPGLRMHLQYKKEWTHICTVEEICFLAMRDDGTVEISRKNGIPVYLKFFTVTHMLSFLSVCDGYYRLMVKWTFNLCKGVPSPSLEHLYQMKCHGPVGGEFSYNKLQEKRSCAPGCYILRQCQHEYDVYYLDVCSVHSNTPETYKIEFIESNYYLYDNEKVTKHGSLEELISLFKDPTARIYLKECLPASEYDKSPLLLCGSRRQPKAGDRIDQVTLDEILKQSRNPRCIDTKDVLLFKGSKFEGTEGLTITYKAMWNVSQDKKIDVAFKMLKSDQHLKEFIDLTGRWAFAKSDAIVRLYGVTLRSPSAMVMEYMKLGPLDEYLRKQKNLIQPVDLVEAAASVATALWNLSESDMVHGYLRCRKILVAAHDSSKFVVKLAEPGLHCYNETDCHWLPIECFSNPESAQTSTYADVWALGTTLWEIFSYGLSPAETNPVLTKMSYTRGHRLSMPDGCPAEVYSVMMSCWLADPHRRSIPQVIMRDLCHLLYQVYNSRRVHSYSTVILKTNIDQSGASTITSDKLESYSSNKSSLLSVMTDLLGTTNSELDADSIYGDFEPSTHDIDFMRSHTGMDNSFRSVTNMHCIFELDHDATVTRQGLLGQGFYGEVYRGILERTGCQPQDVAIKKLKTNANNAELNDFIREINIMKSLRHPNIVSILGIIEEPEMQLVMEYVEHGSLQSYVKIYRQRLTTQYFLKFAHSIAEGMSYLGVMNVVHRDLAARNILVANEGHVKITDFGLAQETKHDDYYLLQTNRNLPLDWYAPESVRHHKFSTRSDVWSYGVTMWEMFSYGDLPPSWAGYPSINVETREQSFRCPAACPELVFEELVRPCWNMTPSERPKFFDIVTICIQLMHKH